MFLPTWKRRPSRRAGRPRRGRDGLIRVGLHVVVMVCALAVPADSAEILLHHPNQPGVLARYAVRTERRRLADDNGGQPAFVEVQTGRLTRAIFAADRQDDLICVQMLELDELPQQQPADAAGAGNGPPADLTEPSTAPASAPTTTNDVSASQPTSRPNVWLAPMPARTYLSLAPFEGGGCPLAVPARSARLRALLPLVLHVTDWPDHAVAVGDTWQRQFRFGEATGRQRFSLRSVSREGRDTHATIDVVTEPDTEAAALSEMVQKATATVVWSIPDRELIRLTGRLEWRDGRDAGGALFQVDVVIARTGHQQMSLGRRGIERKALLAIIPAATAYQRGDSEQAAKSASAFINRWPGSYFRPVAGDILQRIEADERVSLPMPMHELRDKLVSLLTLWDAGESEMDIELLDQCRRSFGLLVRANDAEVRRLLDDGDAQLRALACFALAFGGAPAEIGLIQRCAGDGDPRVRRLAMRALTIRASPLTDVDVLLAGLKDTDEAVRARACAAIAACVTTSSPRVEDVTAALVETLGDDAIAVVLAAAKALVAIDPAGAADHIRKAVDAVALPVLREELLRLTTTQPAATQQD